MRKEESVGGSPNVAIQGSANAEIPSKMHHAVGSTTPRFLGGLELFWEFRRK
jgi:hypothetical protein